MSPVKYAPEILHLRCVEGLQAEAEKHKEKLHSNYLL